MKEYRDSLKDEGMHAGARADKFEFAKLLRKVGTPQEKKLWNFLRTKPNAIKFRRQHPFKHYILDFYCHKAKLVIEIDGHQHKSNQEYDKDRTEIIESYGIKVIRFENRDVDDNFEMVINKIMKHIKGNFSSPQP